MDHDSLDALPMPRELDAGAVFARRFRIARVLGQGGMGSVYEAQQLSLDRRVALKLLHPALTMDLSLVQRFQREAKLMAALRHPHIVEVIDAGIEEGTLWIAMEFLEGESLGSWLDAQRGLVAPEALIPRVAPIGRALSFMHARGIIHRDVKPDNVMLAREGDGDPTPKLLDLGIAHRRVSDGAKLTETGALLGTPAYIAPEQALGAAELTPAADQWSFAAMLYEAFTGRLPHSAETPMGIIIRRVAGPAERPEALVPGFDPALAEVLMRALAQRPEERFASIDALLDALTPFASHPSVRVGLDLAPMSLAPAEQHDAAYVTPADAPAVIAPEAIAPAPAEVSAPGPAEPLVDASQHIAPQSLVTYATIAAVLVAAAVVAVITLRETPGATRASSPTPSREARDVTRERVTFVFDFSPSSARIRLDERELGAGHASLSVPRDGREYALRVEAEGCVPYTEVLRARGDVQISRTLLLRDAGVIQRAPVIAPRVDPGRPAARPAAATLAPGRRPIDTTWPP